MKERESRSMGEASFFLSFFVFNACNSAIFYIGGLVVRMNNFLVHKYFILISEIISMK